MPSPYAATSPRITFVVQGKKPHIGRLRRMGLNIDIGPVGRIAGRPVLWRCYLDDLLSN